MEEHKLWYTSKTLWVNLIAIGVLIGTQFADVEVSPELTIGILAAINVILRIVTKSKLDWENPISRKKK